MLIRAVAAAVVVTAALAGCGTTVPLTSQTAAAGSSSGLDGTTEVGPGGAPTSEATAGSAGPVSSGPGPTTTLPLPGASSAASADPSSAPAAATSAAPAKGGTVEVGFFVVKDLGAATKALGVSGLSTGNGPNQARASVALLNRQGGLNGKTVKPVIYEQDATQEPTNQYQAGCALFFDDHKVAAVVGWGLIPLLQACAAKHHVPYVTSGNRTSSPQAISGSPYLAVPSQLDLDRLASTLVPSLVAQGYFKPRTATEVVKIGLLYNEDPDFAGVPGYVTEQLAKSGLTLTDKQSMPGTDDTSRVTAASSAGSGAVLRFRSEAITHVITIDKSGQALAYFALAAQNQSYYPQFGLSSLELPGALRTVVGAKQLHGARGIGWLPSYDVPSTKQPALTANGTACVTALKQADQDMSIAATRGSALALCDATLLLGAAFRGQALTSVGFLAGLTALGSHYASAVTFGDDFRSRRDGVAQVRPMAYQEACDCFAYTGPTAGASS